MALTISISAVGYLYSNSCITVETTLYDLSSEVIRRITVIVNSALGFGAINYRTKLYVVILSQTVL